MTNLEIERRFELKVREERRVTNEVIELIVLVEDRKIYAERGYPSLFEWLTQKYGYSEPAANRRISAARLLRSVPQTKEKLESGELNLTTVAKAQSIFRAQEKAGKKKVSIEEKVRALKEIENKSTVKAQQTLFSLFPEVASQVKQERLTVVDENNSRLNTNMPKEVMERFNQVRDLLSHTIPNATFVEVADYLFQKLIKEQNSAAAKQSVKNENKTVTKKTRRIVLKRSDGRCTFKDPLTGKTCGATYQVQVDHEIPKAMGGSNAEANLRGLCGTHNRLMAEKHLGKQRANRWRQSIKQDS